MPSDRIAAQLVFPDLQGPVAVKYGLKVVDIAFEITKEGNRYKVPANQGIFKPSDVCCPSDYPKCVCWNIPSITQGQVSTFPEAPGHVPAIDGKWETTDSDKRFFLDVSGGSVNWSERGTQNTTPGASLSRNLQLVWSGGRFRIERPNDNEALAFLGFQPQSLRDSILARGPQPSFVVFEHRGESLSAEWSGLLVTKNPSGTLKDIVQPGVRPPKTYEFRRVP